MAYQPPAGFVPQPRTGNPQLDAWAAAQDQANLSNIERYEDIRGGPSDAMAAMGGYLGRLLNAMYAFNGRQNEIVREFANTEGHLKNDMINRGMITSYDYQKVGLLAQQRQAALDNLRKEMSGEQARLHGDLLSFMERRTDEGPNLDFARFAAQQAGLGGVPLGGYAGGSRPPSAREMWTERRQPNPQAPDYRRAWWTQRPYSESARWWVNRNTPVNRRVKVKIDPRQGFSGRDFHLARQYGANPAVNPGYGFGGYPFAGYVGAQPFIQPWEATSERIRERRERQQA